MPATRDGAARAALDDRLDLGVAGLFGAARGTAGIDHRRLNRAERSASVLASPALTGAPAIAPCGADIGDDRRDFVVGQRLRERRHAIGHRVACGAGRIAAVQHHADRIDRRSHLDRLIAGERRKVRRLSEPLRAMTDSRTDCRRSSCPARPGGCFRSRGCSRSRRAGGLPLRKTLEVDGHRLDVGVRQILQAVVDDLGHRPVDRAARGDPGLTAGRQYLSGSSRRVPPPCSRSATARTSSALGSGRPGKLPIPNCRRAR